MANKKNKWPGICGILIIILFMVLLGYFIGVPLVKYVDQPDKFRAIADENMIGGRVIFIIMSIVQVIVALVPGEPFEILAGYTFGAFEGTVLCVLSQALGSVIVFVLVRNFGNRIIGVFFNKEKINSLKFLKFSKKRDILFLIIFMIPGTPKDLITYFAGITDIKFGVWVLICSLGRLPSIITSTVGGNALGTENYIFAIIVFAVTMIISFTGLWIYNFICTLHQKKKKENKNEC